jgi:hypothetical protein
MAGLAGKIYNNRSARIFLQQHKMSEADDDFEDDDDDFEEDLDDDVADEGDE